MTTRKIYIFDADGVAIEPWGFANKLRDKYGITREMTGAFFSGPFQDCLLGKKELRAVLPSYLEQWGWEHSVEEFIDFWLRADDKPGQELLEKVRRLRADGKLCCLASNQEPLRATYIREDMDFAEKFDRLYFSCDLGAVKPQEAFFTAIELDLGVEPGEIHFWDDSVTHVEAAKRARWNAYVYKNPESPDVNA